MDNTSALQLSNKELLAENIRLKDENSYLKEQINQLKRMIFGQKRERFVPVSSGQLSLFDDDDVLQGEKNSEKKEEIVYSRRKPQKKQTPHFRNPIPAHIPRREIIIEPEGIDTKGLKRIGEEITEELEYEAPKLHVNKYIRPKYAKVNGEGVIIAQLPSRIIPKGIPGPGLISHILVSKFLDHLPIYRIRRQLKRMGVDIAESTINDWIKAIVELLKPLYNLQVKRILDRDYLMVDETTLRVLDSLKIGKTHRGYLWVYYDPIRKEVFFEYRSGRNSSFPEETLKDFTGYLQTDGYSGYNEIGRKDGVVQLACFAHVRRKFENALNNDRERAGWMLKHIRYLYLVERAARDKGLSPAERCKFRQKHSSRQLEKIHQWLLKNKAEVLPRSSIGNAIDYTLSLWTRLIRYLEDGRIEIDNNLVENSIRPVAIGRKNYLFAGSHNGAQWAAILYTLLGTAELQGLEPQSYLKELLEKLPDYPINKLEDLLPANWKTSQKDIVAV